VLIGQAALEGEVFSADPAELPILSHRQHGISLCRDVFGSPLLLLRGDTQSASGEARGFPQEELAMLPEGVTYHSTFDASLPAS
jgi:hypothetical protein